MLPTDLQYSTRLLHQLYISTPPFCTSCDFLFLLQARCFSSHGEDSSGRRSEISLPRKCLRLRDVKRIAVAPAKRAGNMCAVESGRVQESHGGCEASANDIEERATDSYTPLASSQSQRKSRSSGSTLDGSWLPYARSSSVTTAEHSRAKEDKWIRPASYVQTPAGVTATVYDSCCRNIAVRAKTSSDLELPDQVSDWTASNRKRNEIAEKSSSITPNASSLNVRSRNCSCACHTRPTDELILSHEAGNAEKQSAVTIDTRISRTSAESRAAAKRKEGREERGAFNGRMTIRGCSAYLETPGDAGDDDNHEEGCSSMQRLKSAMTDR